MNEQSTTEVFCQNSAYDSNKKPINTEFIGDRRKQIGYPHCPSTQCRKNILFDQKGIWHLNQTTYWVVNRANVDNIFYPDIENRGNS